MVLDLCEYMERTPTVRLAMQYWEQAGIDLVVDRERAAGAADAEEYEREH